MERFTRRVYMCLEEFDEIAFLSPHDPDGFYNLRDIVDALTDEELLPIAEKFAAYEDTGLTPGEIKSLQGEWHANLAALDVYRKAEADGRLIILPCKVGDTVYLIPTHNGRTYCGVAEDKIQMVGLTSRGVHIKACLKQDKMYMLNKRAFLTREEAEKALEAMEK